MSTLCPICNGFSSLQVICDHCGSPMEDTGRIENMFGPYSPYRDIDHAKLTNGYPDLELHQCVHVGICYNCSNQQTFFVQEI